MGFFNACVIEGVLTKGGGGESNMTKISTSTSFPYMLVPDDVFLFDPLWLIFCLEGYPEMENVHCFSYLFNSIRGRP